MSKLQLIEKALKTIDPAGFQNLCDSFISLRNHNYKLFLRAGSQLGKQKTTTGTPDTLLMLPNGHYIMAEFSTNESKRISKIIDDIRKCLDTSKTGIPIEKISEIIICLNFKLKKSEIKTLDELISTTGISITIYDLGFLSIEIHTNHRHLVHEFLNLSFDTGQVVSIETFIKEYNRKASSIATPLNNLYIKREQEEQNLSESLQDSDLIIVTGSPGVGKTRLCIETIKKFITENQSYKSHCISYKGGQLLEDLLLYLPNNENHILFVDDANQINSFKEIIGFYVTKGKGKLKVIATVRDYAFSEIGDITYEYDPVRIDIKKLTDEHIKSIISAKPYQILNSIYQEPIISIADGNPRLAIMASILANEEQDPRKLSDVSDLFKKYLGTFIADNKEFSKSINIKCLGLIAFFHSVPYSDRNILNKLLSHFDISSNDFMHAITTLELLELVENQFDHVKISEQNLSTYYFFKAFIEDQILSFEKILKLFFKTHSHRFNHCIVPANNMFGPKTVMAKLQPSLKSCYREITGNFDEKHKYLSTFWYYLPEETLELVLETINNLPNQNIVTFKFEKANNQNQHNTNHIIDLLGPLLQSEKYLSDAIKLLLDYARKSPKHLSQVANKLREKLVFNYKDEQTDFRNQNILFDILIGGVENEDELSSLLFFKLSPKFLGYQFQNVAGNRKDRITISYYSLPDVAPIHRFREKIWNTIFSYFQEYQNLAFDTLKKCCGMQPDIVLGIMQKDSLHIIKIINAHLSPTEFDHCLYVQNQVNWF